MLFAEIDGQWQRDPDKVLFEYVCIYLNLHVLSGLEWQSFYFNIRGLKLIHIHLNKAKMIATSKRYWRVETTTVQKVYPNAPLHRSTSVPYGIRDTLCEHACCVEETTAVAVRCLCFLQNSIDSGSAAGIDRVRTAGPDPPSERTRGKRRHAGI